jgi:hypothetical protein
LLDCFHRALPAAQVDAVIDLFERLDTLDQSGVGKLSALIASFHHGKPNA